MDCQIRPWVIEDAENLSIILDNKKIQKNLRDGLPFPYTVADAKNYISWVLDAEKGSHYVFAVVSENMVVGNIGVLRGENIHRFTAEMGYYIAESYWNKGIGTKAIEEICRFVFENTDIIRIFAQPFANNIASCRILEKAGFTYEGLLRNNAVKDGEVLDMKSYARIKSRVIREN